MLRTKALPLATHQAQALLTDRKSLFCVEVGVSGWPRANQSIPRCFTKSAPTSLRRLDLSDLKAIAEERFAVNEQRLRSLSGVPVTHLFSEPATAGMV